MHELILDQDVVALAAVSVHGQQVGIHAVNKIIVQTRKARNFEVTVLEFVPALNVDVPQELAEALLSLVLVGGGQRLLSGDLRDVF